MARENQWRVRRGISRPRRSAADTDCHRDRGRLTTTLEVHVLLPKQVTPYRIDFPHVSLGKVKNVRMDVKATLVPASSDPVIGVMNQKLDKDAQGHSVLRGELLNESGQTVNIPHVIDAVVECVKKAGRG